MYIPSLEPRVVRNNEDHGSSRRWFLKSSGATIAAGSLAGCTEQIFGGSGGGGGGLIIGFYGPFSGPASNIGEQKQSAARVTSELINENGGVHGEDIELAFGDSESAPAAGRNAVSQLISQESVDIIGGGFHSDVALSVLDATAQEDVPQIIDEAVSSEIVDKINENELWNAFKTAPPSQSYGVGWHNLITHLEENELGYFPFEDQTVSIIAEDTSYGLSIMDSVIEELEAINWEVISEDEVGIDETDFTSLLSRIQSDDPDVLLAIQTTSSGSGNLARQFAQTGFENTHFFHNYGLFINAALETAGAAANGALTLLNAGPIPDLLNELGFIEAWEEDNDIPLTGSVALSYQNIRVIADLVDSFDSLDAFRSASIDEWAQHVIDHEPINGGTGYINYQDNHQAAWGDTDTQPALAYQIVDQETQLFWPEEFATSEFDGSFY